MKKLALIIGVSLCGIISAYAQDAGRVVTSCNSATLTPGTNSPIQIDIAGNLCVGATSTPSGSPTEVVGNVSNDDVDSGNPVKIGGYASLSSPPVVNSGDRVNSWFGLSGQQMMGLIVSSNAGADDASQALIPTAGSTPSGSPVGSASYLFDGTNWDRARGPGNGAAYIESGPYSFGRVTADGQIKGSAGFIHTITIAPTGAVVAGVLTVYNSTMEGGTVIFSTGLPVTTFTPFTVTLDVAASTGIYVGFDGTLANAQITVSYR